MKRQDFFTRLVLKGVPLRGATFRFYGSRYDEDEASAVWAFLESKGFELLRIEENAKTINYFFQKEVDVEESIKKAKSEYVPIYNPNKDQSVQDLSDLGLSFKEINKIMKERKN